MVYGEICGGLMDVLNEDERRGTLINVRKPEKNITCLCVHCCLRVFFFIRNMFSSLQMSVTGPAVIVIATMMKG